MLINSINNLQIFYVFENKSKLVLVKLLVFPLLHYNVCLKESSSSSIAHLHLYTERVKSRDSETV